MSKSQRDKGARGELHARDLLRVVYPLAKRSAAQWRGAEVCDVEETPYWVESKAGKSPPLWAALRQAQQDKASANDPRPLLLYLRRDRTPPVIVMLAEDWIRIEAERILGRVIG